MTETSSTAQDVESDPYVATRLDQEVKLRLGDSDPENLPPKTPVELLREQAERYPDRLAMAGCGKDGQRWTYAEYLQDVETAAAAFVKLGLNRRRSVAIVGLNAPQWFLADLGAVFADGVAVGVYPTSTGEAARQVVTDAETDILVVENQEQIDKFLPIKDQFKAIVQYDGAPCQERVISWEEFMNIGRLAEDDIKTEMLKRSDEVKANQCAHLVYTSGTEGPSKGVMLSGDSLTYVGIMLRRIFHMGDDGRLERIVSFLPLCHVAANVVDIFVTLCCGGSIHFADK